MSDFIFEISSLWCSYNGNADDSVLKIEGLNIPRCKIVFFVGPSGIGKSTILETLGLMTNTIVRVGMFKYKDVDLREAWKWNDKRLSDFRKTEYSFIFQDNNLMPNFSAYENVMITAMLQGLSKEESLEVSEKIIAEIMGDDAQRPPTKKEIENRSISSFSGGQRQRLAFARAILPNFSVIFGDEPTGNLDSISAEKLMEMLLKKVHERKSTAIIVSHDLRLACKYADMIVRIRKSDNGKYGVIDDKSCYVKNDSGKWSFGDNVECLIKD